MGKNERKGKYNIKKFKEKNSKKKTKKKAKTIFFIIMKITIFEKRMRFIFFLKLQMYES